MTSAPDDHRHPQRDRGRLDAQRDPVTHAALEDLAGAFRRSRAAVLREVIRWGLSRGKTGTLHQGDATGPIRRVFITIGPELHLR